MAALTSINSYNYRFSMNFRGIHIYFFNCKYDGITSNDYNLLLLHCCCTTNISNGPTNCGIIIIIICLDLAISIFIYFFLNGSALEWSALIRGILILRGWLWNKRATEFLHCLLIYLFRAIHNLRHMRQMS